MTGLFESLDYLYVPMPDVEAGIRFYCLTLGGEVRWHIRQGPTSVAAIRLAGQQPLVLLASHLPPGHLIPIYRVPELARVQQALAAEGWATEGAPFELPVGPCIIFRDPGGQRLAAYERRRPQVEAAFEGRFDSDQRESPDEST